MTDANTDASDQSDRIVIGDIDYGSHRLSYIPGIVDPEFPNDVNFLVNIEQGTDGGLHPGRIRPVLHA